MATLQHMTDFLSGKLSHDPDPRRYDPQEYLQYIREYQVFLRGFVRERLVLHGIQDAFRHTLKFDTEPTTIGSDGRFEKPLLHALSNGGQHPERIMDSSLLQNISPVQVVFVGNRTLKPEELHEAQGICADFILSFRKAIFEEISAVNPMGTLLYNYPDRQRRAHYHPSRALDASSIGDMETPLEGHRCAAVAAVRSSLLNDMRGPAAQDVLSYQQERLKEHRQITTRGTQKVRGETLTHFDLATGEVFLHKNEDFSVSSVGSVKYGPLRLGQLFIVREVLKGILTGDLRDDDIIALPNATADKIEFLQERLGLVESRCKEFHDLYTYFLHLYSISQYEAANGRPVVQTDAAQLRENIDAFLGTLEMRKETRNDASVFGALRR